MRNKIKGRREKRRERQKIKIKNEIGLKMASLSYPSEDVRLW
jgi:hypothetical protein